MCFGIIVLWNDFIIPRVVRIHPLASPRILHLTDDTESCGSSQMSPLPQCRSFAWLKAEHLYGILWLTTPKTHAAHRFVPISTSLWQRLWARIKRLDIGPRDLIFTNSRGNPVRSSTERYNWNKALKAAGLPPVTIHSARHWTASMTARANMPDDARTAIMGHTSISMTNHYTHRDAASLAALLDRAIPDLHDERDVIDAQVIEEGK